MTCSSAATQRLPMSHGEAGAAASTITCFDAQGSRPPSGSEPSRFPRASSPSSSPPAEHPSICTGCVGLGAPDASCSPACAADGRCASISAIAVDARARTRSNEDAHHALGLAAVLGRARAAGDADVRGRGGRGHRLRIAMGLGAARAEEDQGARPTTSAGCPRRSGATAGNTTASSAAPASEEEPADIEGAPPRSSRNVSRSRPSGARRRRARADARWPRQARGQRRARSSATPIGVHVPGGLAMRVLRIAAAARRSPPPRRRSLRPRGGHHRRPRRRSRPPVAPAEAFPAARQAGPGRAHVGAARPRRRRSAGPGAAARARRPGRRGERRTSAPRAGFRAVVRAPQAGPRRPPPSAPLPRAPRRVEVPSAAGTDALAAAAAACGGDDARRAVCGARRFPGESRTRRARGRARRRT